MRIALGLEYDGTHYAGWQIQPESHLVTTLQGCLEAAVSTVADSPVPVVCAGRTDAGVHALQQTVHFSPTVYRPLHAWMRGVNGNLPKTMVVRWVRAVDDQFHARHSAISRRYTYVLMSKPTRPALAYQQAGWTHLPLNLSLMQQAAQLLLGEHDFSTFRASECQARTPVRTVQLIEIVQRGQVFFITAQANAFLHHMMRNIVGALVYVGSGRWSLGDFTAAFAAKDRKQGAPTFMASGLYFCGASYDASFDLPVPVVISPEAHWPWGH